MNPSPLFKLSENSSALVGGVDSMEATFSNSCDGGLTNERTKRTKEFLTELIKHNYLGTLLRLWRRVKRGADRICHIGVGDPKVVQPVLHFGHQNWKRFIARVLMRKTSQELRMLSSVTINCQITKIVMNTGSQLTEL